MVDLRPITVDDIEATYELSRLAFGGSRQPITDEDRANFVVDGVDRWGAFDRGRLVAKVTDRHHGEWWGGRVVPACGVAGVAVEGEARGAGVATRTLTHAMHAARERGAVIASLFCTSANVYRAMGFEATHVMRDVAVPTDALLRVRRPDTVRLRAGTGRDWALTRQVYDEVARAGNGMLSRRGPLYPDPPGDGLPEGVDGLTIATDDEGALVGYSTWSRGEGYHADSVITVRDCLALTREAAAALLTGLTAWSSVAPTVRLRLLPWVDPVRSLLPWERLTDHRSEVWMHRPIDVAAAASGRDWSPLLSGTATFRLADPLLPWNDGAWRLTLDGGEARLEPAHSDPGPLLDVRGWSLLWCGAARSAHLRQAGLLTGPTDQDAALDALLASGGPAGPIDYF
jgi:predicted acetyltransferase